MVNTEKLFLRIRGNKMVQGVQESNGKDGTGEK